jgi:hypothetical protein
MPEDIRPGLVGPGSRLNKGDRVLVSGPKSQPMIVLVSNPDGPIFIKDAEPGKFETYIAAASDVIMKIELSETLETVRRML